MLELASRSFERVYSFTGDAVRISTEKPMFDCLPHVIFETGGVGSSGAEQQLLPPDAQEEAAVCFLAWRKHGLGFRNSVCKCRGSWGLCVVVQRDEGGAVLQADNEQCNKYTFLAEKRFKIYGVFLEMVTFA